MPAPTRMLLVLLDPYLLGDPLFLTQLARDLAHRGGGALLVHGSGEAGERALEATGVQVRQLDGVPVVESPQEAAIVERATRDLNRQIVHELNEVGVSAVRLLGADRGLLKRDGDMLAAGDLAWIGALVSQGVVGVLAALVEGDDGSAREVELAAAVAALAAAREGTSVAVLSSRSAPERAEQTVQRVGALGVAARAVPATELRSLEVE